MRIPCLLIALLCGCSSGGAPGGPGPVLDLREALDLGGGPDLASADAATPPDQAQGCVTSFQCDARTAEHECGVTTATGQRYPDRGTPYCTDRLSREKCSCDLVRCVSPQPLCPGSYKAIFTERLIAGCNGVPGQLDGTCAAVWNVVEAWPGGAKLSDQAQLNVTLSFSSADYAAEFSIAAATQVRLVVEQNCWFADVSGVGNAGRSEVSQVRVALR